MKIHLLREIIGAALGSGRTLGRNVATQRHGVDEGLFQAKEIAF
jgi:hypothetical protein